MTGLRFPVLRTSVFSQGKSQLGACRGEVMRDQVGKGGHRGPGYAEMGAVGSSHEQGPRKQGAELQAVPGWGGGVLGGPSPRLQGGPGPCAGRAGWHGFRGVRPPSRQAGAPGWGLVAAEDSPGTPGALGAGTESASPPAAPRAPGLPRPSFS